MSLEKQLHQMIQLAGRDCMENLKWRKTQLMDLYSKDLRRGAGVSRVEEEFGKTCSAIEEATNLLEEIEVLNVGVLRSDHSKIVDIKLNGSLYRLQKKIQGVFELQQMPKRGFVYVSWCQSPEDFFYVGSATDVHQLDLKFQEKLATTVGEATWLSLLFPTQSAAWMLESIEHALLTLIQYHLGRLPQLNRVDVIEHLLERVEIYTRESTSWANVEGNRSPAYSNLPAAL